MAPNAKTLETAKCIDESGPISDRVWDRLPGQVIGRCTAAPDVGHYPQEEMAAPANHLTENMTAVAVRAARTHRVVDTVVRLGKVAYPGLRPHLLAAITDDDTIIDDLVVAFLDQIMGYDMVHAGIGIVDQP